MRNLSKNLSLFLALCCLFSLLAVGQVRCYTYDTAGCRVLRDKSCDPSCSTYVTNTNDSGAGSLRQAVNCAENGDTITFAPDGSIIHIKPK